MKKLHKTPVKPGEAIDGINRRAFLASACAFASAGGVKASAATLAYGDGALRFTYTPPGMVITIW